MSNMPILRIVLHMVRMMQVTLETNNFGKLWKTVETKTHVSNNSNNILFIMCWNVAGAVVNPNGITVNSN